MYFAAHSATASDRRTRLHRFIAWPLIALMIWQPTLALADVVPVAPDGYRPTLDTAANGVDVMNIANPDKRGLSHNLYNRFDVGSDGLILNNSSRVSKTDLAGYIEGNANLHSGSARVILNEVIQPDISDLNGYIEVAGRKAEVIIANPWGISCDGCGFINTERAILTTGSPVFGSTGSLQGFDVQGGNVQINGAGLNALGADRFDIVTRSLNLNASLLAHDTNIVLGKQQVAYADLSVSDVALDADAPVLALDSTALGGIYAGRIRLLSSEDGVGVRLSAPLAAQTGDVTLDVNGDLRFTDVSAKGAVSVDAGSIQVQATDGTGANIVAGGAIGLASDGDLDVNGASLASLQGAELSAGADLRAAGTRIEAVKAVELSSNGELQMDASSAVTTRGELAINAKSMDGGLEAALTAPDVNINVTDGLQVSSELDLTGSLSLSTAGTLQIDTAVALQGKASLQAEDIVLTGAAEIGAHDISINAGRVQAEEGSALVSTQDLVVTADTLYSQADLVALRDLKIAAADATNLGLWYAERNLVIDVFDSLVNGSEDHAAAIVGGSIDIRDTDRTANVANNGSLIQSGSTINFDVSSVTNTRIGEEIAVETTSEREWLDVSGTNRRLKLTTINTEVIENPGKPGEIVAADNIHFLGDLNNDASTVFTPGDITIDGLLVNEGRDLVRTYREQLYNYHYDNRLDLEWVLDLGTRQELTGQKLHSVLYAGGTILNRGEVKNGTEAPMDLAAWSPTEIQHERMLAAENMAQVGDMYVGAILDDAAILRLLDNVLFSVDMTPENPYLIETRYQFVDWKGFHGSEYLLDRVGWVADGTVKLLGDEYAEVTLTRQQIFAMTGRPLLSNEYKDEAEQYTALVDNAYIAAGDLKLSPGVALTEEQINLLTSDIVWPVIQTVAGVEVMVPVLYLSPGESALDSSGSVIVANNVHFTGDEVNNGGTIEAYNNIEIDSDVIVLNGDARAGNTIRIKAADSLSMQSINMLAENIYLESDGDIDIETFSKYNRHVFSNGVKWETLLGRIAALKAANNLSIKSAGNINLAGANLSGHAVSLDAGESVNLGAVQSRDGIHVFQSGDLFEKDRIRYTVSSITSVVDALISAEKNITALGADIESGGDIALFAGGDIELLAAMKSDYSYVHDESDRVYGSKTRILESYEESADVVTLKAGGNVLINTKIDPSTGKLVVRDDAKGNVTIEGAEIASDGTTGVYAGNELLVTAAVENAYHHAETRREYDSWASETAGAVGSVLSAAGVGSTIGLATGQEVSFELKGGSAAGSTSQTLRDTRFSGAGDIVLLAGEGVTLAAGEYQGDNLFISSGLNKGSTASTRILGLQTTNSRYSTETNHQFGQTQGFASLSTRASEDVGRQQQSTRWHGTAIDITDNVFINSAGNMILQGASVGAGGDINMAASGAILFDAGYSSNSYSETLTNDANLGEYLETQRALSKGAAEVTGLFAGGSINITSVGDQIYVGSEMQSGGDITLDSKEGAVRFEATRNTTSTSYTEQSSDFSWVTMKSEGSYDEVLRMVSLQPGGNLVIDAAKGISVDIEKIDGKTGPALIDALVAENPEMAWLKDLADQGEIDWNEVEAVHERWSEEQEGLGAGASAVIAIVVTTLTGGTGSGTVGGMVTNATNWSSLGVASSAVVSGAATQVTLGTINNGGKLDRAFADLGGRESLEGLGVGALTAGLTTGLDALFDKYWKWGRLDGVAVETNPTVARITYGFDLSNPAGIYGFAAHSASKGLLAAGVQNAVFEGDFKDYLKDALESQGNNVMSALAFYGAGSLSDYLASGSAANESELGFNVFSEKGFGRTLLHSAAGGAISDAMGGEFRTGAAAAAFNHLTSSAQDNLSRGLGGITPWTQQHGQPNPWRNATSEIAGVLGAALVEGDVEQGRFIAGQAQAYNAELHPDDSELLDKAREIVLADESLSAEEKADRIDRINALACKESRCFDHLPPAIYSTPEAMQLAAWQAKGDADPDDIVSVLESMGLEADGAFDSYGWDSQLGDFLDRNDEVLTRGAGLLQTGGGVVGTFGGAAMAVGGFGSCGVTLGGGCALGAGGVGLAALGVSEIDAGIDRMFASYETNLHIRTMNSFYPDRHEGERYALGDSFLGIGIFATEMIAGKFGGKVLAKSPLGDWSPSWFGHGSIPETDAFHGNSWELDLARQRAELRSVDTAGLTAAEKGVLGEQRSMLVLQRAGYQEMPARLSSNNGLDGVFVKYDFSGNPIDIIITESKFSSSGRASLVKTITMGRQMSPEWIDANISKMMNSSDMMVMETGYFLDANKVLIRTKANILTPDGVNRWNKVRLPELWNGDD